MGIFSSLGNYFALDIGTTAVRVLQLKGGPNSWTIDGFASVPVDIKISGADSNESQHKLGEIIMTAIGQSGIKTRDVIVGVPSNKTFVTVVELPEMSKEEMSATVKYQAEQYIPMSINEAKVDWAVLGRSVNDASKNEVLLASIANSFIEDRMDFIESLGFNILALEPDSIALTRALLSADSKDPHLIVQIGEFSTDISVAYENTPRLIRVLPIGMQTMVKAVSQNLNVESEQATQFMLKFGLLQDKLEGQVVKSVNSVVEQFLAEIVKSIKFFQNRYQEVKISDIIIDEYGVMIPGFGEHITSQINFPVKLGDPWSGVNMNISEDDKSRLSGVSAHFSTAVGLAKRGAQS